MTIRSRIILFVAPAILFIGVLLGRSALRLLGVAVPRTYTQVDLKALGNFPFNRDDGRTEDIPQRWRDLDGQRVSVDRFMFNARAGGAGLLEYQFVYDLSTHYHGPPLLQERIYATAPASLPVFDVYSLPPQGRPSCRSPT